jgi:deazaflavin-dependent oxidoreductase (nitroreductase family)
LKYEVRGEALASGQALWPFCDHFVAIGPSVEERFHTQLVPMTWFDRVVGVRLLAGHQFVYELSGGRIGERVGRVPMLLLHTTGRKTGRPRTAALLYHHDRDDYVVVGSKGGSDTPPAWLLNLKAIPDVGVQVGRKRFAANARIASAEERRRFWPEVARLWPQYDRYQSQTRRRIPLVILTPLRPEVPKRPRDRRTA